MEAQKENNSTSTSDYDGNWRKSLEPTIEGVRASIREADIEFDASSTAIESVESLMLDVRKKNIVCVKIASWRNVILVGKSKAGKSSAISVLRHLWAPSTDISVFAGTESASAAVFTMVDKRGASEVNYNLTIIDTPGLSEQIVVGSEIRTDAELMRVILACLDKEVRELHAVFFVCSTRSGLSREDVEAVTAFARLFAMANCNREGCGKEIWKDRYVSEKVDSRKVKTVTTYCDECYAALEDGPVKSSFKMIPGIHRNCALLVTRAELMGPKTKDKIKTELRQVSEFSSLLEVVDDKVFFIGCVRHDDIRNSDFEMLQRSIDNIRNMREGMINFIIKCDTPFAMDKLPIFAKKSAQINALLEEEIKLLAQRKVASTDEDKLHVDKDLSRVRHDIDRLMVFVSADNIAEINRIRNK